MRRFWRKLETRKGESDLKLQRLVPACLLLLFAACGGGLLGGGGSPAAPSPPPVSAPVISGTTDMVFIGQRVTFAATGTGPITWGGDQPSVATIDAQTGAVTGIGTGRVTIWADNSGGRSTRLLRVLPSYNGSWSGTYTLTGCQSTSGFAAIGFCGSFSLGQNLSIGMQLTQNRDAVTGSFDLGSIQGGTFSSGVVNEDGSLPLSGSLTSGSNTIQLSNLRATSPAAGTMRGSFDQIWSSTVTTGTGRLSCDIRALTRTSGAPSLSPQRTHDPLSLEDVIRAALVRF